MNLQVIASPGGDIVWVSVALPVVHDKKAEWIWGVLAELEKSRPAAAPWRAGQLARAIHVLRLRKA